MKHRQFISIALAALTAALTTGCEQQDQIVGPCVTAHAADLMEGISAGNVTGKDADDPFIQAQTAFALRLLKQECAAAQDENLLLSPYSVMQALAMTANGAAGDTRTEMETVLGSDIDTLNEYLYTQRISQPDAENCKLLTANSVWFRDDEERIQVFPDFLQVNADYYGAAAYRAPFDNSTLSDINNWVSLNTDGMIPKLIDKIPGDAVMYLINAVTFDAKWAAPYVDAAQISDRAFTAFDGSTKTVSMMYSEERTYYEDAHATGFAKYYADRRYAFAALLPEEGMSVSEYISGLTAESLAETLANPISVKVSAGLPQFSYDYDTELSDALAAMGMPSAFSGGADFSRMGKTAAGELFIGRVLHKTHIEVDTEGTKAAAVTAVEMEDGAALEDPEEIKYVVLDRPFLYMILDTETRLPVFIGTVGEP